MDLKLSLSLSICNMQYLNGIEEHIAIFIIKEWTAVDALLLRLWGVAVMSGQRTSNSTEVRPGSITCFQGNLKIN